VSRFRPSKPWAVVLLIGAVAAGAARVAAPTEAIRRTSRARLCVAPSAGESRRCRIGRSSTGLSPRPRVALRVETAKAGAGRSQQGATSIASRRPSPTCSMRTTKTCTSCRGRPSASRPSLRSTRLPTVASRWPRLETRFVSARRRASSASSSGPPAQRHRSGAGRDRAAPDPRLRPHLGLAIPRRGAWRCWLRRHGRARRREGDSPVWSSRGRSCRSRSATQAFSLPLDGEVVCERYDQRRRRGGRPEDRGKRTQGCACAPASHQDPPSPRPLARRDRLRPRVRQRHRGRVWVQWPALWH
jgi:hypothetical protein